MISYVIVTQVTGLSHMSWSHITQSYNTEKVIKNSGTNDII